jgi:hypothetical protein
LWQGTNFQEVARTLSGSSAGLLPGGFSTAFTGVFDMTYIWLMYGLSMKYLWGIYRASETGIFLRYKIGVETGK